MGDALTQRESLVGGKALRLAELAASGHPVPPACVLSTAAVEVVAQEGRLLPLLEAAAVATGAGDSEQALAAGAEVSAAFAKVVLPRSLVVEIRASLRQLSSASLRGSGGGSKGGPSRPVRFVLRSSAAGEDGSFRSHAGQYESLLNLQGEEEILEALPSIWASWYGARAIRYRLQARSEEAAGRDSRFGALPLGPVLPPMAVVIQRMIWPRSSGMLFTAHPVTGSSRQMMVESGLGLGEALAQGRILPDCFLVEPRLGGRSFSIVERGLPPKDKELLPELAGNGSLRFSEVEKGRRSGASLSDREVRTLCRRGLSVQRAMGGPVDLEWTVDEGGGLWLLQARPVTGIGRSKSETGLGSREFRGRLGGGGLYARPPLWTQRFAGERWTEQATPLGWSIVQDLLHHFIFWEDASDRYLDGEPPTRLYRGRPYFNVTIFRFLAFRGFGGRPPQFLLEMFPPEEQAILRDCSPRLPHMGLVGSILWQGFKEQRWERYRSHVLKNHREWAAYQPEFEAAVAALPTHFRTVEEGLVAIEDARALMVRYLGIHLMSLLYAHLGYELLDRALRSWVGLSGETLRSALVAEPLDNRTLDTNEALWELAEVARGLPELERALSQPRPPSVEELADLSGGPGFLKELERFLEHFGHRSSASWEIFATRWADSPEWVLQWVGSSLRSEEQRRPAERAARRASDRDQAERMVRSRMARTLQRRLFPWRQQLFSQLLHHCRRYMALRENQRFSFDRLLLRMKRVFERLGAILESEGRLLAGEELVFLEWPELRRLTEGSLHSDEASALIARRKEAFASNQKGPHPDFLMSDGRSAEPLPEESDGLVGLPISAGRARGPVRVLHSLDDLSLLRPGDVLVTRAVDPGWTPLFLIANGLVLELGSVLSHGAVVAREYGLPAVVNVAGATSLLKDGQWVEVDGDLGRVRRVRAENDPPGSEQDVMDQGADD